MQLFPEVPILRFHEYLSLIRYLNWYLSQNFEKQVNDVIVYLVTIISRVTSGNIDHSDLVISFLIPLNNPSETYLSSCFQGS